MVKRFNEYIIESNNYKDGAYYKSSLTEDKIKYEFQSIVDLLEDPNDDYYSHGKYTINLNDVSNAKQAKSDITFLKGNQTICYEISLYLKEVKKLGVSSWSVFDEDILSEIILALKNVRENFESDGYLFYYILSNQRISVRIIEMKEQLIKVENHKIEVTESFNSNDIKPIINWFKTYFTKERIKDVQQDIYVKANGGELDMDNVRFDVSKPGWDHATSIAKGKDYIPVILEDDLYKEVFNITLQHFEGLTKEQQQELMEYITLHSDIINL